MITITVESDFDSIISFANSFQDSLSTVGQNLRSESSEISSSVAAIDFSMWTDENGQAVENYKTSLQNAANTIGQDSGLESLSSINTAFITVLKECSSTKKLLEQLEELKKQTNPKIYKLERVNPGNPKDKRMKQVAYDNPAYINICKNIEALNKYLEDLVGDCNNILSTFAQVQFIGEPVSLPALTATPPTLSEIDVTDEDAVFLTEVEGDDDTSDGKTGKIYQDQNGNRYREEIDENGDTVYTPISTDGDEDPDTGEDPNYTSAIDYESDQRFNAKKDPNNDSDKPLEEGESKTTDLGDGRTKTTTQGYMSAYSETVTNEDGDIENFREYDSDGEYIYEASFGTNDNGDIVCTVYDHDGKTGEYVSTGSNGEYTDSKGNKYKWDSDKNRMVRVTADSSSTVEKEKNNHDEEKKQVEADKAAGGKDKNTYKPLEVGESRTTDLGDGRTRTTTQDSETSYSEVVRGKEGLEDYREYDSDDEIAYEASFKTNKKGEKICTVYDEKGNSTEYRRTDINGEYTGPNGETYHWDADKNRMVKYEAVNNTETPKSGNTTGNKETDTTQSTNTTSKKPKNNDAFYYQKDGKVYECIVNPDNEEEFIVYDHATGKEVEKTTASGITSKYNTMTKEEEKAYFEGASTKNTPDTTPTDTTPKETGKKREKNKDAFYYQKDGKVYECLVNPNNEDEFVVYDHETGKEVETISVSGAGSKYTPMTKTEENEYFGNKVVEDQSEHNAGKGSNTEFGPKSDTNPNNLPNKVLPKDKEKRQIAYDEPGAGTGTNDVANAPKNENTTGDNKTVTTANTPNNTTTTYYTAQLQGRNPVTGEVYGYTRDVQVERVTTEVRQPDGTYKQVVNDYIRDPQGNRVAYNGTPEVGELFQKTKPVSITREPTIITTPTITSKTDTPSRSRVDQNFMKSLADGQKRTVYDQDGNEYSIISYDGLRVSVYDKNNNEIVDTDALNIFDYEFYM